MSSIDNRIVQMQFENSQFEKGVKESIKSIKELEEQLKFKDAEKGLQSLQKAGDSFSLATMAQGIEKINEKFSVMGIIGKRVLEDLTSSAVHMGEKFLKSVSTDQISAGFSKYADKTKAVQTIVNATGMSIEDVDAQLSKLALFTDETSYNFVDMVSNIGKFTSMNVPLDKSVTAMEGIATWAAVSGQGINEASRAMYNMSQAMGAGSVKLMDWKSIENANMATAEFKQTAIDTAMALGVLKKGAKTSKGTAVTLENFSQTLNQGWFTSDVLLTTLGKYGEYADKVIEKMQTEGITAAQAMEQLSDEGMELGAKAFKAAQEAKTFVEAIDSVKDAVSTGWMNMFENVFGNYEEAKIVWTDLANYLWDIFAAPLSDTNELLAKWKEFGGRAQMLRGIYDIFDALADIIGTVGDAFRSVFPEITLEQLLSFSDAVAEFGANFKKTFGRYETTFTVPIKKEEALEKIIRENNFQLGDRSEAVKDLQTELVKLGYLQEEDFKAGTFGVQTQKALEKYQNGIKVAGMATQEVLENSFNFGDKGKEVEELQQKLEDLGFSVGETGVDGIWGKNSQKAFDEYLASLGVVEKRQQELKKGDKGEDVKKLQEMLIASGIDELQADGIFGPKTEAALKKWQEAHGIVATGIFDEDSMKTANPEELKTLGDMFDYDEHAMIDYSDKMQNLFFITRGLSSAVHILTSFFGFLGNVVSHVASLFSPLIDAFIAITASVANSITVLDQWIQSTGLFDTWFENIKKFLEPFGEWIKNAADGLLTFFGLNKKAGETNGDLITLASLWERIKNAIKATGIIEKVTGAWNKFKGALQKIIAPLKKTGKQFSKSFGDSFNNLLKGLPDTIAKVIEWFGNFATKGLEFITPFIEKIPDAIQHIKDFWSSLTQEGDSAAGKAPGFLIKVRDAFKSVIDFLFGEGDIGNGKQPGIFRRIGQIISDNFGSITEGINEKTKAWVLEKIQAIKDFIQKVREAITYLFGGELGEDKKISDDALKKIDDFKLGVSKIFEAIKFLFTGTLADDTNLSDETIDKIKGIRDFFQKIKDFFQKIREAIIHFFGGDLAEDKKISDESLRKIDEFKSSFSKIFEAIKFLFTGTPAENSKLSKETIDRIQKIRDFIQKIREAFIYFFGGNLGDDKKISDETLEKINSFKERFGKVFEAIGLLFTGTPAEDSTLSQETIDKVIGIRNTLIGVFNAIGTFFSDIFQKVSGLFSGEITFDSVGEFLTNIWESIKTFFANVGSIASENLGETWEKIKNFFSGLFDGILNIGKWVLIGYLVYKVVGFIGNVSGAFYKLKEVIGSYKKNAQALSKTIMEFAIAVALIAGSIWLIGQLDEAQFTRGAAAVGGIILAIVILMAACSRFKGGKAAAKSIQQVGSAIRDIGIGILLIAGTIVLLGALVDVGTLISGILKLGAILLVLVGFMWALNKVGATKISYKGFYQIAIVIGVMALIVWLLGSIDPGTVWKGMGALAAIMILLGAFIILTTKYGSARIVYKGLFQIAIVIGVMALIVWLLGSIDPGTVWKGMGALAAIMILLGAFIILTTRFGNAKNSLGVILLVLAVIGVIAAVAIALTNLKDIDANKIWAFTIGISLLIGALTLLTIGLSKINPAGALQAALALAAILAGLGLGVAAFSALAGGALEDFASNIWVIGSMLSGFSDMMKNVDENSATKASIFLTEISNAFTNIVGVDLSGVYTYLDTLMSLGARLLIFSNNVSGLNSESAGSVSAYITDIQTALIGLNSMPDLTFAKDMLSDIGAVLKLFYDNLAGIETTETGEIDTTALKNAFSALGELEIDETAMANIAKYATDGGGLTNFALGLTNLSTAIDTYGTSIGSINTTQVEAANSVLTTISAISFDQIGVSFLDSIAGLFTGEGDSFNKFIDNVTNLGSALNSYGTNIGSLDATQIANATTVLTTITGLDIDATGGMFQWFTGSTNFAKFGSSLKAIGDGLKQFSDSISGTEFDSTKVSAAISPLKELGTIQASLASTGGIGSWFSGDQSLSKLGEQLKGFGQKLMDFSNEVKDFEITDSFTNSINALKDVAGIANSMSETENSYQSLSDLGLGLEDFFASLSRIGSGDESIFSSINLEDASAVADQIQNNLDPTVIITAVETYSNQITSKIETSITNITDALTRLTSIDTSALNETTGKEQLESAGSDAASALSTGMQNVDTSGADSAASNMANAFKSHNGEFVAAGGYFTAGLATGAKSKISVAIAAAVAVARAMLDAANRTLAVASPSKEAMKIGSFFTEGLGIGTEDKLGYAKGAVEKVTETMLSTASGTMSTLSGLIADGIDTNPVIAPVVDLTNARAAASSLSGMLGGTRTLGVESSNLASSISQSRAANAKQNASKMTDTINKDGSRGNSTSSAVNLTGNNFYIRDERDIQTLSSEIAHLSKQQMRGVGTR